MTMSRVIQEKQSLKISNQEQQENNTLQGKVLITKIYDQNTAFLLRDNRLISVSFFESSKVGNIYLGKIKNIVPNIDACFIEIADKEICFLPLKELNGLNPRNRSFDGRWKEGDEVAVQITRDAQKTKQASVSAHIEFTSQYFSAVLGEEGIYYSKKLSLTEKDQIKAILTENELFKENAIQYSCIIRTAAKELLQTASASSVLAEIKNDYGHLLYLLNQIEHQACFTVLCKQDNQYLNSIHKLIWPTEYAEIVTDVKEIYEALQNEVHTDFHAIRLYEDNLLTLDKLYGLQSKLDIALGERIWLKSGAYLVIEPTEALTVIDVNSGKYEAKRKNCDDYILKINQEAAEEIAVQIRLRNLSGIIIVDFINMENPEDKHALLAYLRQQTAKDIIPTTVVDMTPLGLVEITRKKTEKTLKEQANAAKITQRK